eukprot:GHVU01095994.1.p1 GENE.GHVU01095994.1~~GHVU01095994.1.p1  ORF type:complete len:218 (-),score=32.96 GHVU01095994.1:124-777(-)
MIYEYIYSSQRKEIALFSDRPVPIPIPITATTTTTTTTATMMTQQLRPIAYFLPPTLHAVTAAACLPGDGGILAATSRLPLQHRGSGRGPVSVFLFQRPHLGSTAAPAVALRTVASVSLPSAAPIVAIIPAAPPRLRNRNSTTTTATTTATLTAASPGWCCEGSSDSLHRPRPAKAPRVTGDASGTPAALMVFSDGSMWTLGVCKTRGPFFPSSGGR